MGNCKECPRHALNAPGDFYVEDQACITCGAPEVEAPSLVCFSEGESTHCYFRKQPETMDEVEQAIRAMWASCVRALRYGGNDPGILRRLAELGLTEQCDHPLAEKIEEKLLDHVLFEWAEDCADTPRKSLEAVRQILVKGPGRLSGPLVAAADGGEFSYRWIEGTPGVGIVARPVAKSPGSIVLEIRDPAVISIRGVARSVYDALRAIPLVRSMRWLTREEWEQGQTSGRPSPF
jgi:hypothetical protein